MKTQTNERPLIEQATNILEGTIELAETLVLPPDLGTTIGNDLSAFDVIFLDHLHCKETTRAAREARRAALKKARTFLNDATSVLKPRLGDRSSGTWEQVGMLEGSLQAPRTTDDILFRLKAFKSYFTAHPTHEFVAIDITAAKADALVTEVTGAELARNSAVTSTRDAAGRRRLARLKLVQTTRFAIETLETKLAPDDNRWGTFGLPRPVDLRMPAIPGMPKVIQTGPGKVEVTFAKATRARRYRVFVQAPEEEESKPVATVRDPKAIVEELPTGVRLKFTVTAANRTGESRASEAVELTLV